MLLFGCVCHPHTVVGPVLPENLIRLPAVDYLTFGCGPWNPDFMAPVGMRAFNAAPQESDRSWWSLWSVPSIYDRIYLGMGTWFRSQDGDGRVGEVVLRRVRE
jgi:hypothetical protein